MPLNDELFIQEVISLQDEMIKSENYNESKRLYAEKLVACIKKYLTSATVQITGSSSQGPFTGVGKIE
ncbi:hypothetical protein SAMN05443634_104104 [Chishuiella changwenlii]|jgi:hypothetical protein|uniref:Uncharacterized protein n=1 Tax=Chishuiella changwenlii TaxID=1434701 RepID=A0A1M6VZR3_9FLAO|nr:hypothetical protein [Chishuiella changwenlii]GGE89459.1 hypothetical protein GCM10010984_03870 [Chishuiella changwenlii]SHK86992.1 hypothetical protein SAMN05443634_104104 [Chishuiella changwenlii]